MRVQCQFILTTIIRTVLINITINPATTYFFSSRSARKRGQTVTIGSLCLIRFILISNLRVLLCNNYYKRKARNYNYSAKILTFKIVCNKSAEEFVLALHISLFFLNYGTILMDFFGPCSYSTIPASRNNHNYCKTHHIIIISCLQPLSDVGLP